MPSLLLGRADYQFEGGRRVTFRYSYSDNEALNSNATGNALDSTTIARSSNNGTEKDNTNTFVGHVHQPYQQHMAVRDSRSILA